MKISMRYEMGNYETGIRIRTVPDSQRNATAIRIAYQVC